MKRLAVAAVVLPFLSACSQAASVTDAARDTLSGALAPVAEAINDAARRADEVGQGIGQVTDGVNRVKGAFAGSGSTW